MGTVRAQQQLRFDAVDAGRMLQQLDHVFQQRALDIRMSIGIRGRRHGENIAN